MLPRKEGWRIVKLSSISGVGTVFLVWGLMVIGSESTSAVHRGPESRANESVQDKGCPKLTVENLLRRMLPWGAFYSEDVQSP